MKPLSQLLRAIIFVGWSAFALAVVSGEDAEDAPPEDIKPSILAPGSIFKKEREILRSLTSGDYPFKRGIFKDDIVVKSKSIRLDSGKKVSLVWGRPKKAKIAPAVFVIDVESSAMGNTPTWRFFSRSKRQERKEKESNYLVNSPFGSNLLGQGFVVAYAIGTNLESLRSARVSDWVDMFDEIRELKEVDENSYFLMSTKEYANLSIYLAGKYSFSGFILEEPHYMLFSRKTHQNVIEQSDRLTSDQIWKRTDPNQRDLYHKLFSSIYSPIILVRAENSPAYNFNEKTLIDTLRTSNTYFETINLKRGARNLQSLDNSGGVLNTEPRVQYNPASLSTWLEGMITYMKVNSDTMPVELKKRALVR